MNSSVATSDVLTSDLMFSEKFLMSDVLVTNRPVTRGGEASLEIFLPPLEKCVGHGSKLLDIVKKIWAPPRKLFAPPGVPS